MFIVLFDGACNKDSNGGVIVDFGHQNLECRFGARHSDSRDRFYLLSRLTQHRYLTSLLQPIDTAQ